MSNTILRFNKHDISLYSTIVITFVIPILAGLMLQNISHLRWVSIPFHSYLEASGALAALVMAGVVFIIHAHKMSFDRYHYVAFALIGMGTLDGFHAMVYPGELFVWLHSMAVFAGGVMFAFVWAPQIKVKSKN